VKTRCIFVGFDDIVSFLLIFNVANKDLGSISQKVVSLRLIVSVIVSVISKLLIG
jgi:hypothetical protein